MDEATLERLQAQLQDERAQHVELLDDHGAEIYGEEVRNLNIANEGFADSAQATEERSEILGQIDASRMRVHQVDAALERIDEGTYGICQRCGRPIAAERLEVRPLSVTCVDCAAQER